MKTKQIFDTLNASHHEAYEYELFTGNPEYYWTLKNVLRTASNIEPVKYRNLYTLRAAFNLHTPQRAMPKTPEKIAAAFADNIRVFNIKMFDAELSCYACWALMKEIANETPTEFQQEYFMHPTSTYDDIYYRSKAAARIRLRKKVKQYDSQLSGILHRQPVNQNDFRRKVYKWLFNDTNTSELRRDYKMNETKPLTDYMNAWLLNAYWKMLKNIVNRWDSLTGPRNPEQLYNIAYQEAINARNSFYNSVPENNFDITPINQVEQERKKRELEFAKQCLQIKK